MLLLPCPAGSGSVELLVGAIVGAKEVANRNNALVCMGGQSEAEITSANVILRSLMGHFATVWMLDLLKTVHTVLQVPKSVSKASVRFISVKDALL